jgi:hypothetical protein
MRDFYQDRASELVAAAAAERAANARAAKAASADPSGARRRASQTAEDLARVNGLMDAADRVAVLPVGGPR